ncbi:MAG: RNA polymerase subunit sigma [Paraburkholderia sp.]
MDTEDSRATASSWAATASLALLVLGCFVTGLAAFTVLTDAAFAAEEVEDFLRATGVTLTADPADPLSAEETDLAPVTLVVGSSEPVPAAFFPPVVFAIAIAFRLLPGKQTAENLLL